MCFKAAYDPRWIACHTDLVSATLMPELPRHIHCVHACMVVTS
jgi:nitrous oxide reductase accessory protein NosL